MKQNFLMSFVILFLFLFGYSLWTARSEGGGVPDLQTHEDEDFFYEDTGGWDAMRLPLIYPYEMLKLDQALEINQKLGWSVNLNVPPKKKDLYYYNIHGIREIAVENQVIMIYSSYTEGVDELAGEKVLSWFIIVPDEEIETGFASKEEFLGFVQNYGIQQPDWVLADMAFERFVTTGCLDWIPNCK